MSEKKYETTITDIPSPPRSQPTNADRAPRRGAIRVEPSAETSAIFEPQMSEKKYETTITDMPSPPRSQPTSARAKSTSAYDMPHRSMIVPAKMKLGIASRIQFCEAPIRLDASISSEKPPHTNPVTAAAP